MVFFNGSEEYCQWCGTYLSRKPVQKRGYYFCDAVCVVYFENYHKLVVNLDDYRNARSKRDDYTNR